MPLDARTWSEGCRMLFPCVVLIIMAIATGALVSFYLVSVDACDSVFNTVFPPCALKHPSKAPSGVRENGTASTTHTLRELDWKRDSGLSSEDRSHTPLQSRLCLHSYVGCVAAA